MKPLSVVVPDVLVIQIQISAVCSVISVNSVVKTSQMQDAVHRGVLDGAHYVPAYWYSKSAAASLFGTGPCWGWSANEMLGWIHYG